MTKLSLPVRKVVAALGLALVALLALSLSGFSLASFSPGVARAEYALTNAIQNGDFEDNPQGAVATYWQPYSNGQAHFSWYDEQWELAVHTGQHAQLMEIFRVEGNIPDRVIAIHQTVNVVPNSNYALTIHALMRSDAPLEQRNQGVFTMSWGIDLSGQGNYGNVKQWVPMPLTEQARLGSQNPEPTDQNFLRYQQVTATVSTGNTSRLTLFIRGVKTQPTTAEVNFNIDDVSLVGPYPLVQPTAAAPTPAALFQSPLPTPIPPPTLAPAPVVPVTATPGPINPPIPETGRGDLPTAGGVLPAGVSTGTLLLAGLVLLVLGAGAAASLLRSGSGLDKNDTLR